jgi:hypothetical protein
MLLRFSPVVLWNFVNYRKAVPLPSALIFDYTTLALVFRTTTGSFACSVRS